MAAAPSFLTLEDFEDLYRGEKPHFEYWFGEAIQKSMPTSLHGVVQFIVMLFLHRAGWKAASEVRLKLSSFAHPVPDIIADRARLEDPYPTEPFALCVEILSPGDELQSVFGKAAHYLDWGIGTVWIIDPKNHNGYQMSLDNPKPVPVDDSGVLVAGRDDAEIRLSLFDVFLETDKQLAEK